jgi:hypothetical protein
VTRRARRIAALVIVAGLSALALWPASRHVGVNYVAHEERIPLALKVYDFVSRDLRTRRVLRAIVADRGMASASDDARVSALFDWVVAHVARQPTDRDVIDDHPIEINARGYGAPDQRAEAFALLASYLGYPAAHVILALPTEERAHHLTVGRVGTRLEAFEVEAGVARHEWLERIDVAKVNFERMAAQRPLARLQLELRR